MENAVDNGVKLFLNEKVVNINKESDFYNIVCQSGNVYQTKVVINAAGVYSDEIHKMVEDIDYSITPRKGEYFILDHYTDDLVKHTIFPLPSEKGKGILVTPSIGGTYLIGPEKRHRLLRLQRHRPGHLPHRRLPRGILPQLVQRKRERACA